MYGYEHPHYIPGKPMQMRVERDMPIDEIAGRLALLRTTVFGWTWRSEHGVLAVRTHGTLLCARVRAWMDLTKQDWTLD